MAVVERTIHETISFLNAAIKDLVKGLRPQLALTLTSALLSLNSCGSHYSSQTFDACYVSDVDSEKFDHKLDWILVTLWTSPQYTVNTMSQFVSMK